MAVAKKANSMGVGLGKGLRVSANIMVALCKSLVGPHLEYFV